MMAVDRLARAVDVLRLRSQAVRLRSYRSIRRLPVARVYLVAILLSLRLLPYRFCRRQHGKHDEAPRLARENKVLRND